MHFPGQALLFTAFPIGTFSEDMVFSDYLIDGVELLSPRVTQYGTIHSEQTHGCFTAAGATGDRFFQRPADSPPPAPPPLACPRGSGVAIVQGSAQCVLCERGYYSDAGDGSACQPCAPGYSQPRENATRCERCNPGFFQLTSGATSCDRCSSGSFQPSDGATSCDRCSSGSFQPSDGATSCERCSSGSFQLSEGATSCITCARGTYRPHPGALCTPCEVHTSSWEGASSCTVCSHGRFIPEGLVPSSANCKECPVGANCTWNTTVATILVKPGYWRLSSFSAVVSKCDSAADASSTCIGGTAGDATCADGSAGPLCKSCLADGMYYES